MRNYDGKDPGPGASASPKLDGVFARATKDGLVSKSGKPLDLPHISKRLKRHFRKNPEAVLEGEVFRKGMGIESIAGATRAGGDAAKKLRLHVFPKEGEPRPWSIGAVRRVPGKPVKSDRDVQAVFQKALKRGHEGLVVRGADGVPSKLKPQQDAEWPVAAATGNKRGVLVLKQPDGSTFKVQSRPGVDAKAGDRVQVRHAGITAKGKPKAAVVTRVRNDNDFSLMKAPTHFESPARRILGGDAYVRVIGLARIQETEEQEIERDRRALKRIGIGAAAAGAAAGLVIHKGREARPVLAPVAAAPPVKSKGKAPVKSYWAKKARVRKFATPAGNVIDFATGEKRDTLSKVRDGAIIAGTGAVGVGALATAHQARKLRKKAGDAMGYASSAVARSAREVTPQAVAREGVKLVKRKVVHTAGEYFPTFIKVGKALKKKVFSTPAQRMGVIEFAVSDQIKTRDSKQYANSLKVAAGVQEGFRQNSKVPVDLPIGDMQVIKAAYRKAGDITKWGGRGFKVVKDASDVIRGKPRERDSSGRKKKREWEKSWAQEHAKRAVVAGGVLAYATGMKRSPRFRAANVRAAAKVKDTVNRYLPNTFETPAQRMGITFLAAKAKEENNRPTIGQVNHAIIAGGVGGAVYGASSAAGARETTDYLKLRERRRQPDRFTLRNGQASTSESSKAKPFKKGGKFGAGERLARAEHESLHRLKKTVKKRALIGSGIGAGLVGAELLIRDRFAKAKAKPGERKRFSTPASRMLVELDANAADAGWDVRDPRGRSARVFAPGSRKRVRREKEWIEEVGNERKVWKGAVIGAGLLAAAGGVAVGRRFPKKPAVPKSSEVIVPFPKRRKGR